MSYEDERPTAGAVCPPVGKMPDEIVASMVSAGSLDPELVKKMVEAMAELKRKEKENRRIELENKKRERMGLPPLGELSAEHADRVNDIMASADPEFILAFLCMEKPHTLIQLITHMEKSEYPWRREKITGTGIPEDDDTRHYDDKEEDE